MNLRLNKAVTLLELLIAISLAGIMVLAFLSIELFSRYHLKTSERRAKLQNDVSYILEHMSKEIVKAIGNERIYGANSVIDNGTISNDEAVSVYIDASGNGQREDPINNPPAGQDCWIAYRLRPGSDDYQMWYCPKCEDKPCTNCDPNWGTTINILSKKHITAFAINKPGGAILSNNTIEIQITACWDPGNLTTCGSPDNPSVTMRNRIKMPAVSIN